MMHTKWTGRAFGAAALAGLLGACDFIESTTSDPNQVPNATIDQLFTSVQVNAFHITESQVARLATLWTQQTAGVANQFTARDIYDFDEEEGNPEWISIYSSGGLVDVRNAIELAETASPARLPYAGVLKIHEAYMVGTAADVFGDVPYSQAGDRDQFPTPQLDQQLEVYAAIQARLNEAIANLNASTDAASTPGSVDFNFAGNRDAWIRVANTLKARYFLHTAEVNPAAYDSAYKYAAVQPSVRTNAQNWRAIHTTTATEQNLWFQFNRDRQDHIVGGHYLVNLLNRGTPGDFTDDDPRLPIYFEQARGAYAGTYRGSFVGAPGGDPEAAASRIQSIAGSPAAQDYDQPIVSCTENAAIAAEAAVRKTVPDLAAARTWYAAMIACQENLWGVSLAGRVPDVAALTGNALVAAIIQQKYIGLFLSPEIWNDYKRTCLPAITPYNNGTIPARLYYSSDERQSNPNIPDVNAQNQNPRNDNDPNACPAVA